MFRPAVIAAIKIKRIRHAIDENAIVEHLFPEEVDALSSLPPPSCATRALDTDAERAGMASVLYPAGDKCRD
jgi:hypothetical protein